jgi:fumarate hydratase class II
VTEGRAGTTPIRRRYDRLMTDPSRAPAWNATRWARWTSRPTPVRRLDPASRPELPDLGQRFPRRFIRALALIKLAAAETNAELGLLDAAVARAIASAAATVADGDHDEQFPIDVYQTGSGHVDQHEHERGRGAPRERAPRRRATRPPERRRQPCQSSNDDIPTALQLSAALAIEEALIPALVRLQEALAAKAEAFWPIVKTGRTHLQDATPIRLGQEFEGYAGQVEEAIRRVQAARDELLTVPLGGTAVGTGINAHPEYAARTCARLTELLTLPVREAPESFQCPGDARCADRGPRRDPDDCARTLGRSGPTSA